MKTVFIENDLHKALKLRATNHEKSITEELDNILRIQLIAEDNDVKR